jgi:hypothetical protein
MAHSNAAFPSEGGEAASRSPRRAEDRARDHQLIAGFGTSAAKDSSDSQRPPQRNSVPILNSLLSVSSLACGA